jgi:hypothetical protein
MAARRVDLAALVPLEGAVHDVEHLDPVDGPHRRDDALSVRLVGGLDRHLPDRVLLANAQRGDLADEGARFGQGAAEARDLTRPMQHFDPQGGIDAVLHGAQGILLVTVSPVAVLTINRSLPSST